MQCSQIYTAISIFTASLLCALCQEEDLCPAWYRYNISTGKCECTYTFSGAILCQDPGRVYLRIDLCMGLDNHTNMLATGVCHRAHYNKKHMINGVYGLLPNDSSQIVESQCTPNKRKGFLCAKCIDGHGISVTSLSPNCVRCNLSLIPAIFLYLLIELLPMTILFVIIVVFHINISVGPLLGYFIYCQAYTVTTNDYSELHKSVWQHSNMCERVILYISYTLSAIWALCPFNILPSLCISPKISILDAIAMKYIRVFYPLVLTLFTYFLIELYTRNFKPVVCLWRLVHACFSRVNITIDTNDSIIHAYATLYLLSFAVLNYISFGLLNVSVIVQEDTTPIKGRLLKYPLLSSYSTQHIPYALASYVILFCFGIIPALLLGLYPFKLFQRALECMISQRRRITLNIFVETIHSFYKDGLNGTRDYRSTSGLLLFTTIVLSVYSAHNTGHWTVGMLIKVASTLLLIAIIVAYVQPFQSLLANISMSFHTFLSAVMCNVLALWMESVEHSIDPKTISTAFAVINFIPHFLVTLWIAYKILSQNNKIRNVFTRGLTFPRRIRQYLTTLPRRLISLERYENL